MCTESEFDKTLQKSDACCASAVDPYYVEEAFFQSLWVEHDRAVPFGVPTVFIFEPAYQLEKS